MDSMKLVTFEKLYKLKKSKDGYVKVPEANIYVKLGDGCTGSFWTPECGSLYKGIITFGNYVKCDGGTVFPGASIGRDCFLAHNSIVGKSVKLADTSTLGDGSCVPSYTEVSHSIELVEGHTLVVVDTDDLETYPISAIADHSHMYLTVDKNNIPHINVGCRCFTKKQALAHWKYRSDRVQSIACARFLLKQFDYYTSNGGARYEKPEIQTPGYA